MPDSKTATITIELSPAQWKCLEPERKKRLLAAIKAAFIAETQGLGEEFAASHLAPDIRPSQPPIVTAGSEVERPAAKKPGRKPK